MSDDLTKIPRVAPDHEIHDPLDRIMLDYITPDGQKVKIDLHAYIQRRIADALQNAIQAHEARYHGHQL